MTGLWLGLACSEFTGTLPTARIAGLGHGNISGGHRGGHGQSEERECEDTNDFHAPTLTNSGPGQGHRRRNVPKSEHAFSLLLNYCAIAWVSPLVHVVPSKVSTR